MVDLTQGFLDPRNARGSQKSLFDSLDAAGKREVLEGLTRTLDDASCLLRERAAMALGEIGPEARAAVPVLARMLHEDPCDTARWFAAHVLGRIGAASVPFLVEALKTENPVVRMLALDALGAADSGQGRSVPAILDAVERGEIRIGAASALSRIGATVLPLLIQALMSRDHGVRFTVAMALADMGPEAVPLLLPIAGGARAPIAADAAYALSRLDPGLAVPHLVRLLADPDSDVRTQAAWILGEMGPAARLACRALIRSLRDVEGPVRLKAAEALGRLGPYAEPGVPGLIGLLSSDENWNVRMTAAWALGLLGPVAQAAVPRLIRALRDDRLEVRQSAAEALETLGTNAARAALRLYWAGE